MTPEEYIEQRLDDQIKWYDKKSSFNQKKHKMWQVIKIMAALFITILSLWASSEVNFKEAYEAVLDNLNLKNNGPLITVSHVIGILGAFIVFIESFIKIFDYEKLWIQYRSTAENLKREKLMFQTKSKPYHTKEAFMILVQRCEAIMQTEVQGWIEVVSEKEENQS